MVACHRDVGHRGFLNALAQADTNIKKLAFEALERGETETVIDLIEQFPGLLNQASDQPHGANLIISSLFMIKTTEDIHKRAKLLAFLSIVIAKYSDKLDLSFVDASRNTVFHRVFWYAMEVNDHDVSVGLTNIGIALIKLIQDAAVFRKILALKNKYHESFIQNIYLNMANLGDRLTEVNLSNLENIQSKVSPFLDPFKVVQAGGEEKAGEEKQVDFSQESFTEQLEELLNDGITFALMQEPRTLYALGHDTTLDKTTWHGLPNRLNPFTRERFSNSDLTENKSLEQILKLFNLYKADEVRLVAELTKTLPIEVDAQFQRLDKITRDVHSLVRGYNRQQALAQEDSQVLASTPRQERQSAAFDDQPRMQSSAGAGDFQMPPVPVRGAVGPSGTPFMQRTASAPGDFQTPDARVRREGGPTGTPLMQQSAADYAATPSDRRDPERTPLMMRAVIPSVRGGRLRGPADESPPMRSLTADGIARARFDAPPRRFGNPRFEDVQNFCPPMNSNYARPVVRPVQNFPAQAGPLEDFNYSVAIKDQIVDVLIRNIQQKTAGRVTWYHGKNHDSKINKLTEISNWLVVNRVNANEAPIILALIKHVCSIKRNALGLFPPHSVSEFDAMLRRYNQQAAEIPLALSAWERRGEGKTINELFQDLPPEENINPFNPV